MAKEELIAAHKGTKTGVFSVKAWESGQPQRYGWVADIDVTPRKTMPVELLEFAEIRKKVVPEPVEAPAIEPPATVEPTVAARPKPKRKPTAKKGAKK